MSKADTTRYNFALIATDGANTYKISSTLEGVINTMKSVLYDYVGDIYDFNGEDYDKWLTEVHKSLLNNNGHHTLRFGRTRVLLTFCEYQFKY
jgi:hypothetical protein